MLHVIFYFAVVDIVKDQLEASKPEPVVEEIVSIDDFCNLFGNGDEHIIPLIFMQLVAH